jgi:hypothetical protein
VQCSGSVTIRPRTCSERIATFLKSFRSKFSKLMLILVTLYSHVSVYLQMPFIRIICFIFASKYSHKFAYKYSIWCKTNTFSHTSEYSLQKICFEANIRNTFAHFTFKRIFLHWIVDPDPALCQCKKICQHNFFPPTKQSKSKDIQNFLMLEVRDPYPCWNKWGSTSLDN